MPPAGPARHGPRRRRGSPRSLPAGPSTRRTPPRSRWRGGAGPARRRRQRSMRPPTVAPGWPQQSASGAAASRNLVSTSPSANTGWATTSARSSRLVRTPGVRGILRRASDSNNKMSVLLSETSPCRPAKREEGSWQRPRNRTTSGGAARPRRPQVSAALERDGRTEIDVEAVVAEEALASYASREGISYAAWREIGAPDAVLRNAGVTPRATR